MTLVSDRTGRSVAVNVETLGNVRVLTVAADWTDGLFVLMGTMQNSNEPEALANRVKHFAFTSGGELNVFGMVDAQIAVVEGELLAQMS